MASSTPLRVGRFSRLTDDRLTSPLAAASILLALCCNAHQASAQSDAKRDSTSAAANGASADALSSDESAAERQERIAAERFLELLKKRPRLGTALDKVYGYHVQHGSLDEFSASLRKEAESKSKNSGEAWMLLGLVCMQRGQDAEARQALEKAEQLLPKEPLASFYLGRTLILLGEVDAAAAALERAIERKPARADMLQVFQELGRLYQRTRRVDDAVAVWNRMEKLFPGDVHVQEQIAVVLAEEGANAEALARFEALAKSTKDRFRRVEMAVRTAQLKETVGRRDEALADFESILGQVNPDSWIYQDVRNRIDAVFQSRNDYDGLAKYYTSWIEKHPDDIDAMLRIGRLLSVQRRSPEAKRWFSQAIEKAPSQPAPRLALAEMLERDQDYTGAAAAMEALVAKSPDNPDYIVRWGELVLSDRAIAEPDRAAQAAKIWKKLLDKRGTDPVTVARVADLLRGAGLTEEALTAYRKAVELADSEPQYREYLGEYLYRLGRKTEALVVWRELASGPRETRDNLVRLSEVYATFKLSDEALEAMAKACKLQPTFGQRTRYAEMLREAEQYEAALGQLELAGKLAETPEEHALVLEEQIKAYQASGQLDERIAELETAVAGADKANAATWEKLALYQEANRKYQQATLSIAEAARLEPQSISIHTAAVRVQERAGSFGDAIASLRTLAALDRRFLSNYLTQIATLQMRLGQMDDALATGQQLISAAGAGSEQFRFFADICFQAGKNEQGLDALRRNVRSNPSDRDAVRLLARNLANQFQTDEAIELYWRSYDLSPNLEEKRLDVEALSELYLRSNRFEQLVSRLETSGREENRPRDATLLIAAAHQAAGDLGAARSLLEPLLREDSRDADLLATVIRLAQAEFDWEAAARYQRRLNEIAPTPSGEYQLAKFLLEQGEVGQAEAIWTQLTAQIATSDNFKQMLDRLLAKGETDRVLALVEQAVEREPDDWEMLPVAMSALWRAGKRERAAELADHLLELPVAKDALSSAARQTSGKQASPQAGASPAGPSSAAASPAAIARGISMSALSRSGWLMRLSQNTFWLRQGNDPFGSSVSFSFSSANAQSLYIYTFADAVAFASAVQKLGRPKGPESPAEQNAWLKEQLQSSDVERLWLAVGLSQLINNQVLTTGGSMRSLTVPNAPAAADAGLVATPRSRLLERLYELGDKDAAPQLLSLRYSERTLPLRSNRQGRSLKPLNAAELKQICDLHDECFPKQASLALWLAEEFKQAGREDEMQLYFEEAVALLEANPTTSDATALLRWDIERATRCFVRARSKEVQAQRGAKASAAPYSYSTMSFIASLLREAQEGKELVSLLAQLKQEQAAYAKSLRPSQLAEYDPTRVSNLNIAVGSPPRSVVVQIDFPAASALQSSDLLIALKLAQTSGSDAVKEAVGKRLEQDVNEPDEDVMLSAVDRLCYATWLWWSDAKPAALEQMEKFRELGVATELSSILQSRMLYELGRLDDALAMLQSFRPLNQQILQDRELAILQLQLQKGDLKQAKESAERLFALRLPTNTQLQVAEIMTQLGMREMADSVMQRVRQRGGNDLGVQVQLMQKLVALKKDDLASEIARQILRRTQPTTNRTMRTSNDLYRQQAVRILASTGQVTSMIEALEQRLEKSPNSATLAAELAELYEASGKRTESQAVLSRLAKNDSGDPRSLLAAARALAQAGRHADAVDKYWEAFDKQPQLLNQEYYNFRTSVQQSKQWKKVAQKMEESGLKKFGNSFRTDEFIVELLRNNETAAAKQLTKRVIKEVGIQGLTRMTRISIMLPGVGPASPYAKVFDDEVKELALDQLSAFIDSQADPSVLFQQRSMSTDGRLYGTLSMLNVLLANDHSRLAKLTEKVEPVKAQSPHWIVLQAALHAMDKNYQAASETVKPLIERPEDFPQEMTQAVWELGSLLAHDYGQYQQAAELIEPWTEVDDRLPTGSREINYTIKGLLLFCYMKTDRVEQAKAMLDEHVRNFEGDSNVAVSNPGYAQSQIFSSRVAAAAKYVELDAPLEALQLARSLKNDQKLRDQAQQFSGNLQFDDRRIDQTIEQAQAKLDQPSLERAIQQLVAGPDLASLASIQKYPAFLLIPERNETKDHKTGTTCLLMQVLKAREKKASDKEWGERVLSDASATLMARPGSEQPLLGFVALICLADRFDQPEPMKELAEALIARASSEAADTSATDGNAAKATSAPGTSPGTGASSAKSDALAEAQAALIEQQRGSLWLAVDCLKRRDQRDLAVRLAQAVGTADGGAGGKSIEEIATRLELARLRLELGETESAEKQLRAIIDDLLPAKPAPASKTK